MPGISAWIDEIQIGKGKYNIKGTNKGPFFMQYRIKRIRSKNAATSNVKIWKNKNLTQNSMDFDDRMWYTVIELQAYTYQSKTQREI